MSNLSTDPRAAHPDEVLTPDGAVSTAPSGSGPVRSPRNDRPRALAGGLELLDPREVPLGGPRAMVVRRTLPHRDIRTVGAWCFVDHFGPTAPGRPPRPPAEQGADERTEKGTEQGMHVPPHPHTGLQTVTWLLQGDVEHRDSVGSRRHVRPGELNIMTSGRGIAHSEDSVPLPDGGLPVLHGVQLWVALPDAARHQDPHFEHHADLPVLQDGGLRATVAVGSLAGARSAAATYSPLVGVEVLVADGALGVLPLEPEFEHAVLAVEGAPVVDGVRVPTSALLYLPAGRRELRAAGPGRFLLIGGTPFEEDLLMWWNFIGREHDEIVRDREDWEAGRRFGVVDHPAGRLPAPALPTTRLRARPGRRRR